MFLSRMMYRARFPSIPTSILIAGIAATGLAVAGESPANRPAAHATGAVEVLQLRPNFYMLTAHGVNVALSTGPDGTVVVNTGPADMAADLLSTIKTLAPQVPIRFLINTSADADTVGGNGVIAAAGQPLSGLDPLYNNVGRQFGAALDLQGAESGQSAGIIARQGVAEQMMANTAAHFPSDAMPSETFARSQFNIRLNGTPIQVVSVPAGHSDSDSVVRFDVPDVVVTGAVFDQTHFPVIDLAHGGSIQGELDALNQLLNTLVFNQVPVIDNVGSTLVIPLHGQLSDFDDLATYRDMIATVQARIRYYIGQGKSLKQILEADPAAGYRSRYGSDQGSWTTNDFIEAAYKSLTSQKAQHGRKS